MSERKIDTIVYEGLGFPVKLMNVPMSKILGEWVLDIDLNKLQLDVLKRLIHQPAPLQAAELRFIRKYLELTTTGFGKVFGVTHAAVLKWENGHLPSPALDLYIRMHVMDKLNAKNDEFGKLFHEVSMERLATAKREHRIKKPLIYNGKSRRFASRVPSRH